MTQQPSAKSNSGRRVVVEVGARIELVEPWRAGAYDPPMQDWFEPEEARR